MRYKIELEKDTEFCVELSNDSDWVVLDKEGRYVGHLNSIESDDALIVEYRVTDTESSDDIGVLSRIVCVDLPSDLVDAVNKTWGIG